MLMVKAPTLWSYSVCLALKGQCRSVAPQSGAKASLAEDSICSTNLAHSSIGIHQRGLHSWKQRCQMLRQLLP